MRADVAKRARVNLGGNYCGHAPMAPRLEIPSPAKRGAGGIPRVLTLASERVPQYYWAPRRTLPSLDLANGSLRQQRSERREACVDLLRAILKFTDVASLRVGIPTRDGFMCLTLDYLAKAAGLGMRRTERAVQDLKRAGLLTVSQPRQLQPDGSWKGLAAVKALSRHLFSVFGLEVALRLEQAKAVKRLRRKAAGWAQEDGEPRSLKDVAKMRLLTGHDGKSKARPSGRQNQARNQEEYQRAFNLLCAELIQSHPEWPPDQIRETAKAALEASKGLLRA